jgi:hypothetical protein
MGMEPTGGIRGINPSVKFAPMKNQEIKKTI